MLKRRALVKGFSLQVSPYLHRKKGGSLFVFQRSNQVTYRLLSNKNVVSYDITQFPAKSAWSTIPNDLATMSFHALSNGALFLVSLVLHAKMQVKCKLSTVSVNSFIYFPVHNIRLTVKDYTIGKNTLKLIFICKRFLLLKSMGIHKSRYA